MSEKQLVPTGKLYTSNVTGLKKVIFPADVLLITRAGYEVQNTTIVRELSPSAELFHTYFTQWKDEPTYDWWVNYEQRFNVELKSEEKIKALREVYKKLRQGKNIVLLCFCKDHRYCHRRLVGDFFAPFGVNAEELNPVQVEQVTFF